MVFRCAEESARKTRHPCRPPPEPAKGPDPGDAPPGMAASPPFPGNGDVGTKGSRVYNVKDFIRRMDEVNARRQAGYMKLVVTEIFHSLQGEGPSLGAPAVFIRMGGCMEPLCPWCDTMYAWHEFTEMDQDEILREVDRFACRDVVVTGGEPFLQWTTGLSELHGMLRAGGRRIQYETSGKAGIPLVQDASVVLSPKHIDGAWHVRREDLGRAHWYKFVASGMESMSAIRAFVEENAIDPSRVFVMPLGSTRVQQLERMREVFVFCRETGYRMSPRLQVLVFDGQRGV